MEFVPEHTADGLNEEERRYVRDFEAYLRSEDGFDLAMQILHGIGLTMRRRAAQYPRTERLRSRNLEIRRRYVEGAACRDLAAEYGICDHQVRRIVKRQESKPLRGGSRVGGIGLDPATLPVTQQHD